LFTAGAFAQAPSAPRFTVEEMLKLRRVSDPQLSPDGRSVAYVVTDVSLEKNTRTNHIWLVPVAGGEPVSIARSEKADDTPRWSPDGKKLAFVSTRDGSSQVWIVTMSASGAVGEAKKVTGLATEASGVRWSPDGKWIVFTSDVFPECTTIECNEKKLKEFESRKSKARVFEHLMFRHWVSWKEGRFSHLFIAPADGSGTPRDVTPGEADAPPFSLGGPDDYAFSPDSRELVFARKTDPVEATSTNSDLFVLDLTDPAAKPRKITTNPAADGGPAYSPDGRYIAYRAQHRPGFEADRWQLMLFDRKTGEHRSTTVGWDRSPDSYAWTADSKSLFLTAEEQGNVGVFRLDLAGGAPTLLPITGSASDVSVTADGKTLVFSRTTLDMPAEIYRARADGAGVQAITKTNPGLAAFKLRPAETLSFEGAGGTRVQGWVVKPSDFK
jgi:dipeptidyl aminopeptidase/acylaminoacyl peptidase